ncbi:hypothetical protein NLG97_g1695 [Lecanicillium saksenae]|uniref:Uncharacterized protein n=1 Tax=Lecanicillium saksenae TaxID=468837 RepID=A0ACC1R4D4_9HYPO|nr:hypothetical protein NLG97_g1695 [Lecanicillium saksenae]
MCMPLTSLNTTSSAKSPRSHEYDQLALRNYDACIRGVQRLIARRENGHLDTTLACALMCICFELRIGMPHIALRHLEHSLDIVKANSADEDLLLAFAKLDIQASMFLGNRLLKTDMLALSRISLGSTGQNPTTDRDITHLLGKVFCFLRANPGIFRGLTDRELADLACQELGALERDLEYFRSSHGVVGVPRAAEATMLPQAQQTLWITCLVLEIILLSCSWRMSEMMYDEFLAHFEAITTMAEAIMSGAGRYSDGYKDFRLDAALLYPLYMTAQLCRHPGIRRRLLRLMDEVSFDEGVWDGSSGKNYIQALMRLEEEGLEFEASDLESSGPSVIPEHKRVRTLDVQPESAERFSTFFFRFNRQSGQWDDLVETVVW